MLIRASTSQDEQPIRSLLFAAFGAEERESVANLAIDLLNDKTSQPLLSLVALDEDKVVGHALFTSVRVVGNEIAGGYILAPLAVAESLQRKGLGTRLITTGLDMLKARDASFVLVYGDPNYYSRTGFKTGHELAAPYLLEYPEGWLAQELRPGVLADLKGTVQCATALSDPGHW